MRDRVFFFQARLRTRSDRLARIGHGSVIVPPATILAPHRIELGDQVLVFERVTFSVVEQHGGQRYEPRLRIGDRTVIAHSAWFSCVGEIEVGSDVLIGHGALIADSFHEYADRERPILGQPMAPPRAVRIGSGAFVGPGATVLAGARLGAGSYVVPGAAVTGDIPPRAVVAGNPGEIIRRWDSDRRRWIDSQEPRWRGILDSLSAQ